MTRNIRIGLALALASAALTVVRMLLGDPRSITEVLWAEDGSFPLCARNDGVLTCLFQPHRGFFHLVPRLSAGLVQLFSYEAWPLVSSVMAAAVTALSSLAIFLVLRSTEVSLRSSALAALVLPLSPLFGVEAIGVLASAYVPLQVAAGVAVVVVSPGRRSGTAVLILLLVLTLTIPSTVVFLVAILFRWVVQDLSRKWAFSWAAVVLVGFAVQSFFAFTSPSDRGLSLSRTNVRGWIDGVTDSTLTLVPGMSWTGIDLGIFRLVNPWYGAWMVTACLSLWGMRCLFLFLRKPSGARSILDLQLGLLILVSLGLSLFPSLSGAISYRYFVAPVCLILIGAMIKFDDLICRASRRQVLVGFLLVGLLWAPAFAASSVRSSPAPSWHRELDRVRSICTDSEVDKVEVYFTPVWPGDWNPNVPVPRIVCSDF